MHARFTLVVAAVSFAFAVPARAGVLVVDPQNGPYVEIADAVLAASAGDTVLVHAGTYVTPILVDKPIELVADPVGAAVTCRHLTVEGVPAGGHVLVRGIDVKPLVQHVLHAGKWFGATYVASCQSPAWFEDCTLTGTPGGANSFAQIPGGPGIATSGSAPVVVVRCVLTGGHGQDDIPGQGSSGGGPGAWVGSSTQFYDCVLQGGATGVGSKLGGPGVRLDAVGAPAGTIVNVLFSGGSCTGGPGVIGGDGLSQPHVMPLLLVNLHILDATFTGGAGTQQDGGIVALQPGIFATLWPDRARGLEVTAPVTTPAPVTLRVEGEPGDLVAFVLALHGGLLKDDSAHGLLAVSFPFFGPFVLTTLGPTGQAAFSIPTPALPPGVSAATIMLNPVFFDASATPVLGAPSAAILLQ